MRKIYTDHRHPGLWYSEEEAKYGPLDMEEWVRMKDVRAVLNLAASTMEAVAEFWEVSEPEGFGDGKKMADPDGRE